MIIPLLSNKIGLTIFYDLFQTALIFLLASIVFDAIHYLLHRSQHSNVSLLKALASLHDGHHRFFSDRLVPNQDYFWANLYGHLLPEYFVQVLVTALFFLLIHPLPIILAMIGETLIFLRAIAMKGEDSNHRTPDILCAPKLGIFVTASYHHYHHLYPDRNFASFVRVFDMIFGTSYSTKKNQSVSSPYHIGSLPSRAQRKIPSG
jgi:sterol desaturase/sphingolipid hydroxylase (fatty acid hydroxylase superfamily)